MDECTCGGDPEKCDFYPEKREKAKEDKDKERPHWIITEYGARCEKCKGKVSVQAVTGVNWVTYAYCPGRRKIRFVYCPFCGSVMSSEGIVED